MSRFSIPVHRQTHRTLIGEYKSRHRLHLSVVSQHMRRKSLKRLKLRLTLIVKATPPLWHSFLRHFHWVTRFLPEIPRRHLRRQRLKAQHRDVNCDKISCQLAIQEKGPHVLAHTLNHTPLIIRLQCFQVLHPTHCPRICFWSYLTVRAQCGARFCRQFPKHRSEHLRVVRRVLHHRLCPFESSHPRFHITRCQFPETQNLLVS